MSFFKNLFSTDTVTNDSAINWIPLTEIEQLNEIIEKSKDKTQAIFKHSTRCGVSRGVIKKFQNKATIDNAIDFYYLDLLSYRNISNEIASKFQVIHQSPQLLVIEDGVVAAHDSHYDIMSVDLETI